MITDTAFTAASATTVLCLIINHFNLRQKNCIRVILCQIFITKIDFFETFLFVCLGKKSHLFKILRNSAIRSFFQTCDKIA